MKLLSLTLLLYVGLAPVLILPMQYDKKATKLSDTVFLSVHQLTPLSPRFVDEIDKLDKLDQEAFKQDYNARCTMNECDELGNYVTIGFAQEQCNYRKKLLDLKRKYQAEYDKYTTLLVGDDLSRGTKHPQEIANLKIELALIKARMVHTDELFSLLTQLLNLNPQSYNCLKDEPTMLMHAGKYHRRVKSALISLENKEENIQNYTIFMKQLVAVYQLIQDIERAHRNELQEF